MKNSLRFYIITLTLFAMTAGFIVIKYKKNEKNKQASFYPLKSRKAIHTGTGEWLAVQRQFDELMKIAGTNPDDTKSRISLATLYIQEARVTGDYMYYDMAAMKYVNEVLEKEQGHFEALSLKALLFLSQHHFSEGLELAEKAREANPHNAFIYGILVDGNVEMGNYTGAADAAEKMVSIRPDLRSYSRISYLREIHGDFTGAIDAMKFAVDAGPPGMEATEWARVQLGRLYENTGSWKNAEMQYILSLGYRPGYAYALAGLARVSTASKDYPKAIAYYLQADSLVMDYSIKEQLAEVYLLAGQNNKSAELNNWLLKMMNEDAQEGEMDENMGHYADQELAHTYLKTGDYDKALVHATAEYKRRPANIDINGTLAWVYYSRGDYEKALPYVQVAMKTNSQDPTLLCQAGLIYAKTSEKTKAKGLLEMVTTGNSNISESLRTQALSSLKTL